MPITDQTPSFMKAYAGMQRHRALDLIRGLAALGIAVYHWMAWHADLLILSLGTFGVYLFFVLSALTMSIVYGPVFHNSIKIDDAVSFFRNRFARLFPLLALVAAAYFAHAVFSGRSSMPEFVQAVLTGSGAFGLALPGLLSNATGAWSLGIEVLFYAVVPLVVLVVGHSRISRLLVAVVLLIVLQQLYLLFIAPSQGLDHWQRYTVFLTYAPFFAIGLLIYRLGGSRHVGFLIPMLLGFSSIVLFSVFSSADLTRDPLAYMALMALAAATIYFANRTTIPGVLAGTSTFLGDISYALYLTHPLTLAAVMKIARRLGLEGASTFALFLVAAVGVSFLTYRLFERPLRRLLRGQTNSPAVSTLP